MPQIIITAMKNVGGPSIPSDHSAWLSDRDWPGGGKIKILNLLIGDCTLEVFPATPDKIKDLGENLIKLSEQLQSSGKPS